jgi:hypothetical protein
MAPRWTELALMDLVNGPIQNKFNLSLLKILHVRGGREEKHWESELIVRTFSTGSWMVIPVAAHYLRHTFPHFFGICAFQQTNNNDDD